MICKKCGEQLQDNAKFCPKCGTVCDAADPVINNAEASNISAAGAERAVPRGFSAKKNIIIIIIAAVLLIGGGITAIAVVNSHSASSGVSDKLQLAERYLSEQNYEQAVIEFQKVLEIEPMNVEAYLGLADAYIGLGQTDKAIETLEVGLEKTGDERIKDKLDALTKKLEVSSSTVVSSKPPVSSAVVSSSAPASTSTVSSAVVSSSSSTVSSAASSSTTSSSTSTISSTISSSTTYSSRSTVSSSTKSSTTSSSSSVVSTTTTSSTTSSSSPVVSSSTKSSTSSSSSAPDTSATASSSAVPEPTPQPSGTVTIASTKLDIATTERLLIINKELYLNGNIFDDRIDDISEEYFDEIIYLSENLKTEDLGKR